MQIYISISEHTKIFHIKIEVIKRFAYQFPARETTKKIFYIKIEVIKRFAYQFPARETT